MVNEINKEERFLLNLSKNMKQENVHIKFCKFSLGVGKRTTNIVVLGELGQYPLCLFHIYLETPFCAVIIQFINTHLQTVSCF
jgi:hypothetical protein